MVVITLEKCPLSLRGDLTKWLQEISLGVYVGQVSARVRENLWKRVCAEARNGRATMVYSARNEQHYDFKVHNTSWEPIDYDGIKLMLRPSAARLRHKDERRTGRGVAPWRHRMGNATRRKALDEPREYVVVDLETTGLNVESDEIVEMAAVRYVNGEEDGSYQTLVAIEGVLPDSVSELTGLTDDDLRDGVELEVAVDEFLDFVGTAPLVAYNAPFDMEFIDAALESCGLDELDNEVIDVLGVARKRLPGQERYRLADLARRFELSDEGMHRAQRDCVITREVFVRLLEM